MHADSTRTGSLTFRRQTISRPMPIDGFRRRSRLAVRCLECMLVSLLLVVAAGPLSSQSLTWPQDDPVLRPGDLVNLTVWQMPEMSGEFAVTVDSTLAHPRLNQVHVVGPVTEAEEQVGRFLRLLDQNVEFTMQPLFRIFVGGEVGQPNLYHHGPEVTISQAIALAGGTTTRSRLDRVRLVRDGTVRYLDLTAPNSAAARIPVRSGDEISVARRSSIFRDYVVPVSSVVSAVTGVIRVLR